MKHKIACAILITFLVAISLCFAAPLIDTPTEVKGGYSAPQITVEVPVVPPWIQELYDYNPNVEPMTRADALFFLARMRHSHVYQIEHAEELGHDAERIAWEHEEVILYERLIQYVEGGK